MQVPIPGIKQPVGLGQVISAVLTAVFGVAPCPVCKERARKINQAVTFKPWGS